MIAEYLVKKAAKGEAATNKSDDESLNDFLTFLALQQYNQRQNKIIQDYANMAPITTGAGLLAGALGGGALGKYLGDKYLDKGKLGLPVGMLLGGALGAGISGYGTDKYYQNKLDQPMEMTFTHFSAD